MVASFSKMTDLFQPGPIIHNIARHAVAHDKVVEAADVAFKVDARGNVVMVEPECQASLQRERETVNGEQEKHIVIPRQEAYERITQAARKKMEQLRNLYELAQNQARQWSRFSWMAVFITMLGILLTSLMSISLVIPQTHTSLLILFMSMNIISMLVVGYLLWRAQYYSKLANLYFDYLQEVEKFYEVIDTLSALSVDDTTRGLLQEVVIAQSLGLQSGDIAIRDEDTLSPHSR